MTQQITIVNLETGEEITRDMNADELAQLAIEQAEAAKKAVLREEAEAAKAAAEAKLAVLGLTTDDLKALGL
jgi:hypothetical protein